MASAKTKAVMCRVKTLPKFQLLEQRNITERICGYSPDCQDAVACVEYVLFYDGLIITPIGKDVLTKMFNRTK